MGSKGKPNKLKDRIIRSGKNRRVLPNSPCGKKYIISFPSTKIADKPRGV